MQLHLNELEEALEEIRSGKQETFDRFLDLVQDTVYSFGVKVCGEREDAKDTLQDTLLKAFQTLPEIEIKNAKALKVWLYKVAKNSCLMMRRKTKSEPARTLTINGQRISEDKETLEIADPSANPIDRLLKAERSDAVQHAIRSLPYNYRIVLVLRDLEQLSTNEVSEILGVSRDAVKIRLHRARSSLRKDLQKYYQKKYSRGMKIKGPQLRIELSSPVRRKLRQSIERFSMKKGPSYLHRKAKTRVVRHRSSPKSFPSGTNE